MFDSDAIIPNQYYTLTFVTPGEFIYYCIYHPTMVGEVVVNEVGSGSFSSDDTTSDNEEEDTTSDEEEA